MALLHPTTVVFLVFVSAANAFDDQCVALKPAENYNEAEFGKVLWTPYKSTYGGANQKCLTQALFTEEKKLHVVTASQEKGKDEVEFKQGTFELGKDAGTFVHPNGALGIVLKTDNKSYYVYVACLVEGQDESNRRVKYSVTGGASNADADKAFAEAEEELKKLGITTPTATIDRTDCKEVTEGQFHDNKIAERSDVD